MYKWDFYSKWRDGYSFHKALCIEFFVPSTFLNTLFGQCQWMPPHFIYWQCDITVDDNRVQSNVFKLGKKDFDCEGNLFIPSSFYWNRMKRAISSPEPY
jgi:hypothetical protein